MDRMKTIIAVLIILLLVLQYKLWFGKGSVPDIKNNEQQIALKQQENQQLQKRNNAMASEIKELKQGKTAAQERARHDLGMVKKDETYYQFVN